MCTAAQIFGQPGQLQQVFINMFVNAAQAMPNGGIRHMLRYHKRLRCCYDQTQDVVWIMRL